MIPMPLALKWSIWWFVVAGVAWAQAGASAFLEFHGGLNGRPLPKEFASDTADFDGGNWRALRIPLAMGQAFETTPAFFTLGLQAWYGSDFEIYARFPLRRDLEAWYQSDFHGIQTVQTNELDLNVPTEAWMIWQNPTGFVKLGRFKPDLGPSDNALVLAGAPWHDGFWWNFAAGMGRYDFVLVSLNPHLTGTPSAAGAEPPEGSEAWQQLYNTVPNQRKRIFAEPAKNLVLHRFALEGRVGWLAIIEQSLVGGKHLAFRDMNPFVAWHNNFSDGYVKASTTLEVGLRPGRHSTFYWQLALEDIKSPVGETSGETNPTTLGALAGYRQEFPLGHLGFLTSQLDAVYTDPVFNNHRVPLQKMTSRRLYRSNYRAQEEPEFADVYMVDYPLGYRRGPDAVDLWWTLKYHNVLQTFGTQMEWAWLRQGNCDLQSPYDSCSVYEHALSGMVESSVQADLELWNRPQHSILLYIGGGARRYANLENNPDDDGFQGWGRLGVRYTLGVDRHSKIESK